MRLKWFINTLIFGQILFSTGCGVKTLLSNDNIKSSSASRIHTTSDPAFAEIIKDFEETGKVKLQNPNFTIGDVPVNFGNTENDDFVGVCFTYPDNSKEVIVKKQWWDNASLALRRTLINHELGHCVLNREHHNETKTNHRNIALKSSIMNQEINSYMGVGNYFEGYLHELFTQDVSVLDSLFQDKNI
jgi:hypothetical protein